jgi:hypothetical protein
MSYHTNLGKNSTISIVEANDISFTKLKISVLCMSARTKYGPLQFPGVELSLSADVESDPWHVMA